MLRIGVMLLLGWAILTTWDVRTGGSRSPNEGGQIVAMDDGTPPPPPPKP